jgi:hypothetical protein
MHKDYGWAFIAALCVLWEKQLTMDFKAIRGFDHNLLGLYEVF